MFATDFDRNASMLAECDEIAARLDDPLLHARIKECRGQATLYQGDIPGAIDLLEQARREFQALADPLGEFDTLILLTASTFFLDDPRADEFSRLALALAEQHGAQSSTAYALWAVGIAKWRAGDFDRATRSLRRSVRLFLPMHDLTGISFGVQALSWCASFAEPGERAARLLGAAQAVWRTSGAKVDETTAYSVFDQRSTDALRGGRAPACSRRPASSRRSRRVRRTRSTRPSPSRSVRTTPRMPGPPRPRHPGREPPAG